MLVKAMEIASGEQAKQLHEQFALKEFDPETNIGSNWVNAAIVNGSTAATRSLGFSIRASF